MSLNADLDTSLEDKIVVKNKLKKKVKVSVENYRMDTSLIKEIEFD